MIEILICDPIHDYLKSIKGKLVKKNLLKQCEVQLTNHRYVSMTNIILKDIHQIFHSEGEIPFFQMLLEAKRVGNIIISSH